MEVAFARAILPRVNAGLDFSDSEEEDSEEDENVGEYGRVSSMTAKLFHPAWTAVCRIMENGDMFRLR